MCEALHVSVSGFREWCGQQQASRSLQDLPTQHPVRTLENSADDSPSPALLQSWLNLLCQMIPQVVAGMVTRVERDTCLATTICWPPGAPCNEDQQHAATVALERAAPVILNGIFAQPLNIGGQLSAVVVISVAVEEKQQPMVQSLLGWAEQWLRLLLQAAAPAFVSESESSPHFNSALLPTLELVLNTEPLQAAVIALNDELATRFVCERVVLGLLQGNRVRVRGFSHSLEFDSRTQLIADIEAAMEEVRASAAVTVYPATAAAQVAAHPALEHFWQDHGQQALCGVPLPGQRGVVGVLLCERRAGQGFDAGDQLSLETLGRLLGPVLELKKERSLVTPQRALQAVNGSLDRLLKPGHRGFKATVAVSVLLVLVLVFARGTYRVSAPASVEGLIQRAVVVPFDGYVAEAFARAGDAVTAGEVIAQLDDRELALELRKSTSEEEKLNNEYRKALAGLDRSEARIVQARLTQAQAQSQLLRQKLQRVRLSAPLSGIVISGDLSRSLGAPVEQGQVLFEVAPLDAYRLVLQISEQDIREVTAGQRGELTLTSMPAQRWAFVVEQISPVFTELDDQVSYRIEATLEGDTSRLRPGMAGFGKVDIGRRSLGWILVHKMLDWIRLQWWLWLP